MKEASRASFVDQLVESYIADIALFLMEILGPKRAEIFKRRHLNMRETAFTTTARSPDPTKMSGNSKTSDLVKIEEGGMGQLGAATPGRYKTVYGKMMKQKGRRNLNNSLTEGVRVDLDATSAGADLHNMTLP